MENINVDVIGLQATLQLLQEFSQSGVLQADVGQAFRMRGPCIVYIVVNEGKIVSCYAEDKSGQRLPLDVKGVFDIDSNEGPFAWHFLLQKENKGTRALAPTPPRQMDREQTTGNVPIPSRSQNLLLKKSQLTSSAVPRRIADLDLSWLTTWSPQQKRILRMVYSMVDGRRTVAAIERILLSSPATVQEALVILIAMQVITIDHN